MKATLEEVSLRMRKGEFLLGSMWLSSLADTV